KERVEIRSGPPGFRNRGLSSNTGVSEVAHSVGKLLRQRGCFRFQDTGGINDKNFRKLSPSALSSIWRTRRKGILAVLLRAPDNSPIFRVLLATSGHGFPPVPLKIAFLRTELYFHAVPSSLTTRNLEIIRLPRKLSIVRVRALCKTRRPIWPIELRTFKCCALVAAQWYASHSSCLHRTTVVLAIRLAPHYTLPINVFSRRHRYKFATFTCKQMCTRKDKKKNDAMRKGGKVVIGEGEEMEDFGGRSSPIC
ncbi:uncharacterized protein LOC143148128, partial [Ptiloglossa arizonensis]|uniref:uncharacterized protein LOC143148128 n=1 Tax=Ptiloglossa arizonensis TaxID=3350558 RepID=UPI003FA183B7